MLLKAKFLASGNPFNKVYTEYSLWQQTETMQRPNKRRLRFLFPILLTLFSLHLSPAKLPSLPWHYCPVLPPAPALLIYVLIHPFSNNLSVLKVSLTPKRICDLITPSCLFTFPLYEDCDFLNSYSSSVKPSVKMEKVAGIVPIKLHQVTGYERTSVTDIGHPSVYYSRVDGTCLPVSS